jgi:hypothetical protein
LRNNLYVLGMPNISPEMMRFASQQLQNMTPDQIKQTLDKVCVLSLSNLVQNHGFPRSWGGHTSPSVGPNASSKGLDIERYSSD